MAAFWVLWVRRRSALVRGSRRGRSIPCSDGPVAKRTRWPPRGGAGSAGDGYRWGKCSGPTAGSPLARGLRVRTCWRRQHPGCCALPPTPRPEPAPPAGAARARRHHAEACLRRPGAPWPCPLRRSWEPRKHTSQHSGSSGRSSPARTRSTTEPVVGLAVVVVVGFAVSALPLLLASLARRRPYPLHQRRPPEASSPLVRVPVAAPPAPPPRRQQRDLPARSLRSGSARG